jgi:hypothetical protein
MNDWRPGFVQTFEGEKKIAAGQMWSYHLSRLDPTNPVKCVVFRVVATSPEGEVILCPVEDCDKENVLRAWPDEAFTKANPGKCPFKKGSGGLLSYYLLHEGWSCWYDMRQVTDSRAF